jgi:hypothetical protein
MLVSEAKKRLSRNLFALEHQEIRPENRAHSKGDRSFSVCTLGGGFPRL